MKKILFLSNEGSITGAPIFLVKLLKQIRIEKPELEVLVFFSKYGPLIDVLIKEGIQIVVSEKRPGKYSRPWIIWNRFFHYSRYCRLLSSYKPDLVYSNTIVNSGEVVLAGLAGLPVLLHVHEGKNYCSSRRLSLIVSSFFAQSIIAGSKYVSNVINTLTGRRSEVIYIGVITQDISCVAQSKFPHENFKLGILGTIDPNKGQLVALKALRLLVESNVHVTLHIAGKISDQRYYLELCAYIQENLLFRHVEFAGSIPDTNIFLNACDLLLVPSIDEALPTVILEAFAKGLVVVASSVGGIPEIIRDNINGFLFDAQNHIMLAERIREIIEKPDLLEPVRLEAERVLREKFDVALNNRLIIRQIDILLA